SLIIEQFAAGPLERAAELTLSSPALMTLREYNALDQLSHRNIQHYLDGTMSIAVCIPDVDASGLWVLRQHPVSPAMLIRMDDKGPRLVLGTLPARQDSRGTEPVAVFGALAIERYTAPPAGETEMLVAPPGERQLSDPARQWLVDAAIYLSTLLSGAVQQSVNFALTYSVTRHAFRKPIIAHQLVAARLADMLVSAHGIHLFCRSVAAQDSQAQLTAVSQMARHVCTEAMDVAREFMQLCGGHGFVEGLPPAQRFQMMHWFAMLLMKVEAALRAFTASA
ncbi:MAG: acyl-CoA dehydrogenase family protein, partial [Paraburkholderia tropica]